MKTAEISATYMDHAELLRTIDYDPSSGVFRRRVSQGNSKAGSVVGNPNNKGYLKARVLGQYVSMHRLAWFYMTGDWPKNQIDHINQVKADNRFENLRDVSAARNTYNQTGARRTNKLGVQGVHTIKKTGRFRASGSHGGVKYHLGVFASVEEAGRAYRQFKEQHA